MALNLTYSEKPISSPGTKEGYGKNPIGLDKEHCKLLAMFEGGYAWDEHAQACWMLFGRAVKIQDIEHSIMEGFEVVNFNFRANGSAPAVPTNEDLPGEHNSPQISQKVGVLA